MHYRSHITFTVALIMLGLSPIAAHATLIYTDSADADFGGPMTLAGNYTYTGGQLVFSLTADNTGGTPMSDVLFDTQFVWDSSTGTAIKLNYNSSAGTWGNANPDNFSIASVTGGALGTLSLSRSDVNTPLSATPIIGGDMATNSSTDVVPLIDLGSFTPGQSKPFTIYANANNFAPTVGGYFLAPVPEPSSFALLGAGAVSWCGWRLRRRMNRR